ncbi:hypothetical protein [Streptomyces sp. NPDC048638]|uniref:hypothetical protein n=1 Tax=Streptomyces sp. NPDC048638 TaxID=3365580 RepID=UPI00371B121A
MTSPLTPSTPEGPERRTRRARRPAESVLQYPPGSLVFQTRDPDRTPRAVVRTRLNASSRHRQIVLEGPAGKNDFASPGSLVHVDEGMRPTGRQIEDSRAHLGRAIHEESTRCPMWPDELVMVIAGNPVPAPIGAPARGPAPCPAFALAV